MGKIKVLLSVGIIFAVIVSVHLQNDRRQYVECNLCGEDDTGCDITETSTPDNLQVLTVIQCKYRHTNTTKLQNMAPNPKPGKPVFNQYYRILVPFRRPTGGGESFFDPNFDVLPLFPPPKDPVKEYFDKHNVNRGESIHTQSIKIEEAARLREIFGSQINLDLEDTDYKEPQLEDQEFELNLENNSTVPIERDTRSGVNEYGLVIDPSLQNYFPNGGSTHENTGLENGGTQNYGVGPPFGNSQAYSVPENGFRPNFGSGLENNPFFNGGFNSGQITNMVPPQNKPGNQFPNTIPPSTTPGVTTPSSPKPSTDLLPTNSKPDDSTRSEGEPENNGLESTETSIPTTEAGLDEDDSEGSTQDNEGLEVTTKPNNGELQKPTSLENNPFLNGNFNNGSVTTPPAADISAIGTTTGGTPRQNMDPNNNRDGPTTPGGPENNGLGPNSTSTPGSEVNNGVSPKPGDPTGNNQPQNVPPRGDFNSAQPTNQIPNQPEPSPTPESGSNQNKFPSLDTQFGGLNPPRPTYGSGFQNNPFPNPGSPSSGGFNSPQPGPSTTNPYPYNNRAGLPGNAFNQNNFPGLNTQFGGFNNPFGNPNLPWSNLNPNYNTDVPGNPLGNNQSPNFPNNGGSQPTNPNNPLPPTATASPNNNRDESTTPGDNRGVSQKPDGNPPGNNQSPNFPSNADTKPTNSGLPAANPNPNNNSPGSGFNQNFPGFNNPFGNPQFNNPFGLQSNTGNPFRNPSGFQSNFDRIYPGFGSNFNNRPFGGGPNDPFGDSKFNDFFNRDLLPNGGFQNENIFENFGNRRNVPQFPQFGRYSDSRIKSENFREDKGFESTTVKVKNSQDQK